MSSIDDALVTRGAAFGALTALIGARLYPIDAAPQNAVTPYVVYQQISGPRQHAMGSEPGVASPRFQFSCWGDTSTDARNVGDQVRACYSRFRGVVASVEILDMFVDNEIDLGLEPQTARFQRIVDFIVWHRE